MSSDVLFRSKLEDLLFRPIDISSESELDETSFLLNSHWPKSNRCDWLRNSSNLYPLSFILFDNVRSQIVGHARLCLVADNEHSLYAESVIVTQKRRGQGIGTFLMVQLESYCLGKRYKTLYLETFDQQRFYQKLGYKICSPVQVIHSQKTSNIAAMMKLLCSDSRLSNEGDRMAEVEGEIRLQNSNPITCVPVEGKITVPLPPPLPPTLKSNQPPIVRRQCNVTNINHTDKVFMMRIL